MVYGILRGNSLCCLTTVEPRVSSWQGHEHYERVRHEHEQQGLPPPPPPTNGDSVCLTTRCNSRKPHHAVLS